MVAVIVIIVVALVVFVTLARTIRIVPQARAGVVERLGRYSRTLSPGVALCVPFIDRVKPLIDLREQVVSFPPQPVITEDNLVVSIDSVIYFQVTDAKAATYEIANYIQAIEQLTVTTLRNVIGGLALEKTLTSRDETNGQLRGVLDEATGKWGIRVNRVELKAIDPPAPTQGARQPGRTSGGSYSTPLCASSRARASTPAGSVTLPRRQGWPTGCSTTTSSRRTRCSRRSSTRTGASSSRGSRAWRRPTSPPPT